MSEESDTDTDLTEQYHIITWVFIKHTKSALTSVELHLWNHFQSFYFILFYFFSCSFIHSERPRRSLQTDGGSLRNSNSCCEPHKLWSIFHMHLLILFSKWPCEHLSSFFLGKGTGSTDLLEERPPVAVGGAGQASAHLQDLTWTDFVSQWDLRGCRC